MDVQDDEVIDRNQRGKSLAFAYRELLSNELFSKNDNIWERT